jgi:hypothetical protein
MPLIIVGKKTVPLEIFFFLPRAAISRNVNSSVREDFQCYASLPPKAELFATPNMVAVGFCKMLLICFELDMVTSWKTVMFTAVVGIFRVAE